MKIIIFVALTIFASAVSQAQMVVWPIGNSNSVKKHSGPCEDWPGLTDGCVWLSEINEDADLTWRDANPFQARPMPDEDGIPKSIVGKYHLGSDLNLGTGPKDKGLTVRAIADGELFAVEDTDGNWGNIVYIVHDFGSGKFTSMYAHVDWLTGNKPLNSKVSAGTPIALIGNGNGSWPYHLHFEIREGHNLERGSGYTPQQNSKGPQGQIDPLNFISSLGSTDAGDIGDQTVNLDSNDYNLMGIEIGMTSNEVIEVLSAKFPDLERTDDRSELMNIGGPQPTRVLKTKYLKIPQSGKLARGFTRCVSEMVANEWEKLCVDRMVFAINLGDGEYYKIDVGFVESFPNNPGVSIAYEAMFSHILGEKDPFDARSFVENKYGPTVDESHWNTYVFYFNSAIGLAKVTLAANGFNEPNKYKPVKQYALYMYSIDPNDRNVAYAMLGRSLREQRIKELKKIARDIAKNQNKSKGPADDPF